MHDVNILDDIVPEAGSFYVMAAACLVTAALEAVSPQVGSLISGIGCSPALFWVGWKYSRRRPVN